jgi:hypothetical protein
MNLLSCNLAHVLVAAAGVTALVAEPPEDLKREGAFGFPQPQAIVLCDEPELRVSSWNDTSHLYIQAILWKDGDDTIGESADGRPIGDWGVLSLDVDADGKATPQRDRDYNLNPWPSLPGLRYQVSVSEHAWTGLRGGLEGAGRDPLSHHRGRDAGPDRQLCDPALRDRQTGGGDDPTCLLRVLAAP